MLLLLWDSWDCGTCWDVVGVGEGVGFGRANHECPDNVNVTPCAVCPLLAFFLARSLAYCLSETEIASGLLAVCLPSLVSAIRRPTPHPLLFVFLGCRHLVTRGRRGGGPAHLLPSSLDPLREGEEGEEVGWLSPLSSYKSTPFGPPSVPSLPLLRVAPHDICRIQSADLSSRSTATTRTAAFIWIAVWRLLSMIPGAKQ